MIRSFQVALKVVALAAACGAGLAAASQGLAQPARPAASPLPGSAALAAMPAGAKEVAAVVGAAKVAEKVTLRGRIAMSKDAFDASKAVFTLTDDAAATACSPKDGTLAEVCKADGSRKATVQLVDAAGQPLAGGLDGKGGLVHGAEVFVTGTVASGNGKDALVVNASGIFVPPVGLPAGLISESIKDAKNVTAVRKAGGLKKGDQVAVRGLIGGGKQPFVAGRAVFTLMGDGVTSCAARGDEDHCATPWDYCCEPKGEIAANSATVRVVDAKGNPLKLDVKGRAGIKELSEVVVLGKVAVADKGVLIVDAEALQVVKP